MRTSSIRSVPWAAVVVLLVFSGCTVRASRTDGAVAADLTAVIPAADVNRVTVRIQDGLLEVRPGPPGSVSVAVTVSDDDCERGPGAVALVTRREGGRVRLDVRPSTKDRCDEHWRIEMPAALMLAASGDRADMNVRGIGGGLDLRSGKGTIEVDAPSGDIGVVVENGDVHVSAASTGYGEVRLAAQVGRVALRLDGRPARHPRPPGPGDWIEIGGPGEYRVSLRATVGNVWLDVGAAR